MADENDFRLVALTNPHIHLSNLLGRSVELRYVPYFFMYLCFNSGVFA